MTAKKLYLLGLLTLVGFPLLSFGIHFFISEQSFLDIFHSTHSVYFQLVLGVIVGWSIAILAWEIMQLDFMGKEIEKYQRVFSQNSLNLGVIVFVSLSAGIGEEVFFRGILQPYLGISLTAIIFVAIHGYLNPKNWRISVYGVYMVLGISLVGYCSDEIGLLSAIIAHSVIDIVLLLKTSRELINL